MGKPSIPDVSEWKKYIGKEVGSRTGYPVLERDIRRYAIAIDESNPIYYDKEAARRGKYGAMTAPPGYTCWSTQNSSLEMRVKDLTEEGFVSGGYLDIPDIPNVWGLGWVRGGDEWEFVRPIYANDQITVKAKIADIYEKQGSTGKMTFIVTEHVYTNQKGELVAKQRVTQIGRVRPGEEK